MRSNSRGQVQDNAVCPVCGQSGHSILDVYDDRYAYPGQYRIYQCGTCGHRFLPAHFTSEQMTKLYTDFYPRSSFRLEDYRPAPEVRGFSSWLNGERSAAYTWVPQNVRVLDIGCGFGETLGYHKARGCDAYGVEADENIRRVADQYGFNVHVGVFDPGLYEPGFFDYVTMSQVIEHVPDPIETLRGIARILKPTGVAVVSTPNASGWGSRVFGHAWINWHVPYHCQFFSRQSMKAAAARAGLIVETASTITSSEWLLYQWIHLTSRPRPGEPSAFWSPRAERTLVQKTIFAILIAVHATKINHLITRFFDGLGIGDNYLFILEKK
jgi:2-polyprenyl-3-methyl-5-hydroxy-6-metoxy-1,4-benzoquinol methylase